MEGVRSRRPRAIAAARLRGDALALADAASPVERALIAPLAERYPSDDPAAVTPDWNDRYAEHLREVHRAHRNDPDVAALFAEALIVADRKYAAREGATNFYTLYRCHDFHVCRLRTAA